MDMLVVILVTLNLMIGLFNLYSLFKLEIYVGNIISFPKENKPLKSTNNTKEDKETLELQKAVEELLNYDAEVALQAIRKERR
jgi:hypothetical protein